MEYPQLADQVEMGRASILAARLCGRAIDRDHARMLGNLVIARFEDRERGGLMTVLATKKDGTFKKTPRNPTENARAALFLAELAAVTGDARYRDAADWALATRMIVAPELPDAPAWANAVEAEPPARKKSVSFKLNHY